MIQEIIFRVAMFVVFVILERMTPFHRIIHSEELWLYKNPQTPSYVTELYLWFIIIVLPMSCIMAINAGRKDRSDVIQSLLGFTLVLVLNGVVTDVIKLAVGRPRPDFFFRCFPDASSTNSDALVDDILLPSQCKGDKHVINEGLKSFPSGHTSFSFASLGFISLYLCGKLCVFSHRVAVSSVKLFAGIFPLLIAILVAISRTCDYHHHWQDVSVGALLGFTISYICYRNYYPPLTHPASYSTLKELNNKYTTSSPLMTEVSANNVNTQQGEGQELDNIKIM